METSRKVVRNKKKEKEKVWPERARGLKVVSSGSGGAWFPMVEGI
jgi:hypothetical protein